MKKSYLKYILHAVVLIGLIIAGVKYLNGDKVFEALRTFDYSYGFFMVLLSLGYFALKGWRFVLLTRPIVDSLPGQVIFRAFLAGQAATLVPGGVAARAGILNQADVPVEKGSIPVIFNSGLDQVVLITASLLAALWFEWARVPALILLGVIVILGVVLLIPTSRHWVFDAAEWIAKKLNATDRWHRFLEEFPKVFTLRIMLITLLMTVAAQAIHVITLDLTLRGVGFTLSYSTLTLAYVLPTVLGRLSGLPGGVGVTEAGMVGFLTSISEIGSGTGFAAVAIFRIVTILLPALLGAAVYFLGWRGEKEAEATTTASAPSRAK